LVTSILPLELNLQRLKCRIRVAKQINTHRKQERFFRLQQITKHLQSMHLKAEKAIGDVFVNAVVILYLQLQLVPQLAQTEQNTTAWAVVNKGQRTGQKKRAGKGAPVKDIQGLAFKSALRLSCSVSLAAHCSAMHA
jgi:hypothetical protein